MRTESQIDRWMDGWTDRRMDERTDRTDKTNTPFSQLLNEVPTTDFFKCELARYNSWGQLVPNVKEQADWRFLVAHALLTLFLLVVQVDVLVHRTGAATRHAVSEVSQVHS